MYKIRVTTTVEQLDHDGRVLFSVTDREIGSSIFDDEHENEVSVPRGYFRAAAQVEKRLLGVLRERFDVRSAESTSVTVPNLPNA